MRTRSPVYVEEPGTSSGRALKSVLFTELRHTASSVWIFAACEVGQADSSDYVRAVRTGVGPFPVCGVLLLNEGRNMVILFLVRCTVGKRKANALLERDDGVLGGRAAGRQSGRAS